MLESLHVKNLALIRESEVEFKEGLNILTGETGAGKSIIIGSISLALGEKVPKEILSDKGETALVELVFHVENPETVQAIEALDVEVEEDTVILSRKITSGRAVARINGEAVSASRMREVAALLIDIHGQHEHQSLLSAAKQLDILDEYAKAKLFDKKEQLSVCYREYRKLEEEWKEAGTDTRERERELSLLEYEVKEIEEAELRPGEDEELELRFRKFSNGKKIVDALSAAEYALEGDGEGASGLVGRALRELSSVASYDDRVNAMEQQLTDIDNLMSDLNHEISSYLTNEEFNEKEYYETEKRLDLINHLKAKYTDSIEGILESGKEKAARIEVLRDYDTYLEGLKTSLENKKAELEQLSGEVSKIRKNESKKLCEAITEALSDLNFLDVKFAMNFDRTKDYTANGIDDAEFMISVNPGEPLKPLGKVASGGELSRIALAVKTVMAENDAISTLIFDEIDSGISGRTAQMVSQKMHLLAQNHQIICITHLPQIAAMADAHFLIEKNVEQDSTVSTIKLLEEEESVNELARMLGGVEITDTVRKNAREMREMAHMKK
ncbi:MAG: DNA repair protein RecN [Lachnospiraceae bacterium]|nr:DNA repair protein RecN [Lachnospiraceae bacterium]